ncbi:MAG: hypothetical protein GY856_35140 [bacterium]|nr:hypothetical protein [bacterium]
MIIDDAAVLAHLRAAFRGAAVEPMDGALPYGELGGPGLERLVFMLLVEDGKTPQ